VADTFNKWELCPICSVPMEIWSDHLEGTECERTEDCEKGCGLYHFQHAYGSFRETHGFVEQEWGYTEIKRNTEHRSIFTRRVKEETRLMLERSDIRPFLLAIMENVNDDAPRLVLSDYLEERGLCPLTVEAIRKETVRG
jgi:uncharacterized protein (TIGR02996 family)